MTDTSDESYRPLDQAGIEQLAWDIHGGHVFGTWIPDAMETSFAIVRLFLTPELVAKWKEADIAHVYEHISKAGPVAVNGMPSFMSFKLLSRADVAKVQKRIEQIDEFQKTTAPA